MIRLDDFTAGGGHWRFDDPTAWGRAERLDDVLAVVAAGERRARDLGEWVVMVLAYEAAPAFDAAMRVAGDPRRGVPLVWWQSFAERTPTDPPVHGDSRVRSRSLRPGRQSYAAGVAAIRSRIAAGDAYQVNLTERFEGHYEGTPAEMYAALVGVQRCAFGAYIEMGDTVIASASPELFFRWDGDRLTCRPMKGTAPRRPRPGDDDRAAQALQSSTKEQAENVMIVDLLRNDLGRVAETGTVRVSDLFTLERYETVWQLTSTVEADVAADTTLLDVLHALFPCGSVTGAPKLAAMETIAALEQHPRGVYCGAIGVLAPAGHTARAVFSVPIRTAVLDSIAGRFEYGAGGGITWPSDADAETAEMQAKARILTRSHRRLSLLETLRNDSGGLANIDRHLRRLDASARWFDIPLDIDEVAAVLGDIAPSETLQRVRVLVAADGAITVEHHDVDPSLGVVTLAIDTETTRSDDPYCCHKTTWRRHYDQARQRHPDSDDVVLVNEWGHAIETTIANLAYRKGSSWFVPPLSDGGLAGIAREIAVETGRVGEASIAAADLFRCDELAVLNDLRGWRPATVTGPPHPR